MSQPIPSSIREGMIIDRRYRVEKVLGQGGMGMVLKGTQLALSRPVAIKLMLPNVLGSADSFLRFEREAKVLAQLSHPHIVQVIDNGVFGDHAYLVMEYLEGKDLAAVLDERIVLPIGEAVQYLLQTCDAVHEAHEQGIIHRDLKPANMFLTKGRSGSARIKVLDFGLAKPAINEANAGSSMQLTQTGYSAMGTPMYMPPEQMGQFKHLDRRSDIWSLGVILYQLITGRFPFEALNIQFLTAAILRDKPTAPSVYLPDIPPELEQIILRCLEKDPLMRFATVAELETALQPFASQPARISLNAPPQGPPAATLSDMRTLPYRPSQPGPIVDATTLPLARSALPPRALSNNQAAVTPPPAPLHTKTALSPATKIALGVGAVLASAIIAILATQLRASSASADPTPSTSAPIQSTGPISTPAIQESAPPTSTATQAASAASSGSMPPAGGNTAKTPMPIPQKSVASAQTTAVPSSPTGTKKITGSSKDPNN